MNESKSIIRQHILAQSKRYGHTRTTCPLCSSSRKYSPKEPCFSIEFVEGDVGPMAKYVCHHCDLSGGVRLEETEIYKRPPTPRKENKLKPSIVRNHLTALQTKWIRNRGIKEQTVKDLGLLSGRVWLKKYKEERDVIGFQYPNGAIKWRDLDSKQFTQTDGACSVLWGLDTWPGGDLIIVEGELDRAALHQVGIHSVSVPNGAPKNLKVVDDDDFSFEKTDKEESITKYRYLDYAQEEIKSAKRIILAGDGDDPGNALMEEIARRVGHSECWRVNFPEGCKDPNAVLQKYGEEALQSVIKAATPWPIKGLRSVTDYRSEIIDLLRIGFDRGHRTGILELDNIYTTVPQTLNIFTGVPGSGKSTFLKWLALMLMEKYDWSIAEFTAETPPPIRLLQMAATLKQQPYLGPQKMSEAVLNDALDYLTPRYTVVDESDTRIGSVIDRFKACVLRTGIRIAIIDPFNFLSGSVSGGEENSVKAINDLLVALKTFSGNHGVATWLVAHPFKMHRAINGKYPIPQGYDIAGAAGFRNICDAGITISRCENGNTRIDNWKARYPWVGREGHIELAFNKATECYSTAQTFKHKTSAWSKSTPTSKGDDSDIRLD